MSSDEEDSNDLEELDEENNESQPTEVNGFVCGHCGISINSVESAASHMKSHGKFQFSFEITSALLSYYEKLKGRTIGRFPSVQVWEVITNFLNSTFKSDLSRLQTENKFRNMKKQYLDILKKKQMDEDYSTRWPFYAQMHKIMGDRQTVPIEIPATDDQTLETMQSCEESDDEPEPISGTLETILSVLRSEAMTQPIISVEPKAPHFIKFENGDHVESSHKKRPSEVKLETCSQNKRKKKYPSWLKTYLRDAAKDRQVRHNERMALRREDLDERKKFYSGALNLLEKFVKNAEKS